MSSRPSFLGSGTTSLNDTMTQVTRWCTGAIEVALSKFSPLIYGQSRMPILQRFCYAWMSLFPLSFIPLWILATVPQLSLLNDITIYPEVKNPFSFVFLYVFVLSNLQHMREIYSTGEPLKAWKYEQRIWMMKGITTNLYGSIHAIMEKLGAKEASFLPTNKVIDDDQVKLYQMGIYNFQTSSMFVVPLCSLIILNLLAFVVGMLKIAIQREYIDEIFIQTLLSFYVSLMGYPVLEGMMLRKDKGRIDPRMSFYSVATNGFVGFYFLDDIKVMTVSVKIKVPLQR
ncbi:cellulose synthase-like protein G2 [Tanacetum coccineum]